MRLPLSFPPKTQLYFDFILFNLFLFNAPPKQSDQIGHFLPVRLLLEAKCNFYRGEVAKRNITSCLRLQCRKTTVLSCHRYLINTSLEKMNNI